MHAYAVYGLEVVSTNELPGLERSTTPGAPRVHVALGGGRLSPPSGAIPVYASTELDGSGTPTLVATRDEGTATVRLRYAEGIEFAITADGSEVRASWSPPLTHADAMTFLLGPVLGFVLRCRGVLALHASAAVMGGRAVGFVGPGGVGKSTLAVRCAVRGRAVLTDDVLALRQQGTRWMASPGAPHLKVWDDTARELLRDADRLTPISPTWEKRAVPLATHALPFHGTSAPLAGLLVVGERAAGGDSGIAPLGGREAILALVANTYTNYLLDADGRAGELRALAALVAEVPVARLHAPVGSDSMGLVETVERWLH